MITEILEYKYITHWNLEQLFEDNTFLSLSEPHFPLVGNTHSAIISPSKVQADYFVHKKRRGKPSELRASARDGLISYVADKLKLNGYVVNSVAECSGTLYAIYTATVLSYVHKTPVFVFSADNQIEDELNVWNFSSFGAMHQETGRSFDTTSKGFRMGTGASVLLVKHPEVKYKLPAIATISNYNFYTNPSLITNPGSSDDLIKNLHGIDFNKIDFWNAHATGTPVGDLFEHHVFNSLIKRDIPIVGYKGHIGHCMGGAGGVELGLMFDDYKRNELRPNLILGERIVDDPRIITEPTSFTYRTILKANFGFGGKNVVCQVNLQ